MSLATRAGLLLFGLVTGAGEARAQRADNTGHVHVPVSCSPAAQAAFDRGLALLHHMTYPEARTVFERAVRLDSRCAMARWGIAMTLFQPLWPTRPTPDDIRRGRRELGEARARGEATGRERAFLSAADAFFAGPDSTDYWTRIRRWQAASQRAHDSLPGDPEAAVWLALADLAVPSPAGAARQQADRAADLLVTVLREQPGHPGAMHYLIHADDIPGRERESPEVVRGYERLAPRNPHALHMPTHIYTRLGEWRKVIDGNLKAAEAALEQPAGRDRRFVWDEFPHAIEYLVYAELQVGADDMALEQLRRLQSATERLEPTFKTAFHLSSTAARYALERRDWRAASALVPRDPPSLDWDRFAWPEAVTWFARTLGAIHERRLDSARAGAARLGVLEAAAAQAGEAVFARQIGVLQLLADGWLAQASGRPDSATALVRAAGELEAATPKPAVTPAPTLPASELLGDLLLVQRHPADALAAYRRSLELYPNRLNSMLGAARAARAAGERSTAIMYYARVLQLAGRGSRASVVREARAGAERRTAEGR